MSDFFQYFDEHFAPLLGQRAPTFRAVIREALVQDVRTIIETGSMRQEDNWRGDGQSTRIWDKYAEMEVCDFTSIDLSEVPAPLIKKWCVKTEFICADSVQTLAKHEGGIDLLYLDSYDVDMTAPHPAALHCLFEFCAALPHLFKGSIVFIDDSPMRENGQINGKGMYVAQYLKQLGILPFTTGYQIAWLMP